MKRKYKEIYYLLCSLLVFVVIAYLFGGISVSEIACPRLQGVSSLDMTLTAELAQSSDVLCSFFTEDAQDVSDDDHWDVANQYLPAGARCMDVSVSGEVVYLDYELGGIRYIVAYYRDGTVEKVARPVGGNEMYAIDSVNNSVEITSVK